mmetsp:Transcript_87151/g.219434  ORF Transcript_87151/g.219434 Transcript_87151/m.219434 type:complete len:250 (-) Transcript_87151:405-1154(-)
MCWAHGHGVLASTALSQPAFGYSSCSSAQGQVSAQQPRGNLSLTKPVTELEHSDELLFGEGQDPRGLHVSTLPLQDLNELHLFLERIDELGTLPFEFPHLALEPLRLTAISSGAVLVMAPGLLQRQLVLFVLLCQAVEPGLLRAALGLGPPLLQVELALLLEELRLLGLQILELALCRCELSLQLVLLLVASCRRALDACSLLLRLLGLLSQLLRLRVAGCQLLQGLVKLLLQRDDTRILETNRCLKCL